jgi:hypothetical protein
VFLKARVDNARSGYERPKLAAVQHGGSIKSHEEWVEELSDAELVAIIREGSLN